MKACLLERRAPVESRPLRVTDVPAPVPGDDELLVSVSGCSICRTDLHVIEGELPQRVSQVIPGHKVVGRMVAMGAQVEGFKAGDRVGVAWLNRTCGDCPYCSTGRENLCERPQFTGWTVNGGFAEYAVAPAGFAYRIPEGFDDLQAAPLLCAGSRAIRSDSLPTASGRVGLRSSLFAISREQQVYQRQYARPCKRDECPTLWDCDYVIRLLDSGTNSLDSAPRMRHTEASSLRLRICESTEEGRRR
jgi:hypothetical protein